MEKLKWKVKHKTSFKNEVDFLETLLIEDGVEEDQIPDFLNPTILNTHDPFLMTNMDQAVKIIRDHVKNNSKILVRVDPDVDGFTSSAVLIQFLKDLNPNLDITYILNYEKKHGLFYSDMSGFLKDTFDLVIIPDASMETRDARKIKANYNADIVVFDHHIIENEYLDKNTGRWITKAEADQLLEADKDSVEIDNYLSYCSTVVNCTDGVYPNPCLSGVGVIQKFIEAYYKTYTIIDDVPDEVTTKYLDLVSLGLIADSMDLRQLESRYYVLEGMKPENYNNEFLNELVKRNQEDMKYGRYIVSMGWQIAPKINGCIRYGKQEEQFDTFRAMIGEQEDRKYKPRKSKANPNPQFELQTLQQTMARVCENIKARQDNEVRKFVAELEKQIEEKGLDKNSILFIDGTDILTKGTVTGLVANKLATKYFRPVVLLRSRNTDEFGGSMRGYAEGPIESTKEFLEKAGMTIHGHDNAAGVWLLKDDLQKTIDNCNEMMPLDQLCTIHQCDWEISGKELKKDYVREVAENYAVFGSTVPEPLFAITNIKINASQIQAFGENKNFIRFTYNGVTYCKKYCRHDEYDNMTLSGRNTFGPSKKDLNINIIGQFVLSQYDDKVIPQVRIKYFDSCEDTKEVKKQEKITEDSIDFDW